MNPKKMSFVILCVATVILAVVDERHSLVKHTFTDPEIASRFMKDCPSMDVILIGTNCYYRDGRAEPVMEINAADHKNLPK